MAKVIGVENILAIRTDAFYVASSDADEIQQRLIAAGFEFGKKPPTRVIPSITLEKDKEPPAGMYSAYNMTHGRYEFTEEEQTNEIVDYEMNDEYSTEELTEIIKKKNAVFSGAYAGVGKTTSAILYCERNGLTYKIATPYGRLRTKLIQDGHPAYTIDRFLGMNPDPKIRLGPVPIEGVDVVIFDEVYLCDELHLNYISDYIKKRPQLQIICTGDEYQLPPVGCTSDKTIMEARNRFFGEHFQARVTLKQIKRVTDEMERACMEAISDYLRRRADGAEGSSGSRPEKFDPLLLEQFDHVKFADLTADAANYTHITRTNKRRALVNDKLEALVGKPIAVGDIFLSVRTKEVKNYAGEVEKYKNLNSQDEYKVSDITDEYIEFRGKNVVQLAKDSYKDYMSRPYAITCNSAQGLSCGDIIYIHETDGWVSNVWLRTAITRCGTFKGIRIVY